MKEEAVEKGEAHRIFSIRTGIVIDHIPAFRSFDVVDILGLNHPGESNTILAIGVNLRSQKLGTKDVIKIENKEISKEELDRISMIAPHASVSRICDHNITEKVKVSVPPLVKSLLKCPNHNCITNSEPVITTFHHNEGNMRCHYCEKTFKLEEMKLL